MEEQMIAPEKMQLSDKVIANLSDAEFKTLVIRMLYRIGWVWSQNSGKSEGYEKENTQGTNSDRMETGTQNNGMEQKEEINIQSEQNEETRIQKNEERLRNLQDIFKRPNIRIIGVPEGEEE